MAKSLPPDRSPERYTDLGAFARGGTAEIHLTMDEVLGRAVAMKVSQVEEPERLRKFQREARVTAQLEHPNIVPVHDSGNTWFTMKRVEGATLGALVRGEPFSVALVSQVLDTLIKVCDALAFAHSRGIIHRDLKPENIMVGKFGQVYLMDWGIAQVAGEVEDPFAGTTGWMAPEQARGEPCTPATDVWGVGAILYSVLCGARPNAGASANERAANAASGRAPVPPTAIAPERKLPYELVRITMRALQPNPSARYPGMHELAADLRAMLDGGWWFERRFYEAESEIIHEGDKADAAYIIDAGTCEVRQNGGPIAELGPGEIFGEAALLAGGPRVASVVAVSDVMVRVITREALDAELGRNRWLGPLVRGLATRFHELASDNLEKRLADPRGSPLP